MVCLVAVSVVAPDPVRQELILVIRIRSTGPDPGDPDLKEKNDLIVFARFTIQYTPTKCSHKIELVCTFFDRLNVIFYMRKFLGQKLFTRIQT